jgi:hypothetical protein
LNKTENALSPLPAKTKASNADMTACLPLQDCIVQTTSLPAGPTAVNFCRRAGVQITRLPALAYGRIILMPRCMHTRAASRYMGGARLQWQVLKLHVCAIQTLEDSLSLIAYHIIISLFRG